MAGLLGLDKFVKSRKGISDRLIDEFSNKLEDKFENSVEDLFGKSLNKIGLSNKISNELSSRFGDSLKSGLSDKYFESFTSEMNRATPEEIENNFSPVATARDSAQTYVDSIQRASNRVAFEGLPTLQFPNHIGKYYMSMKFKQYQRPSPEVAGSLEFKQAFALPIPRSLRESFDIQVGQESQGIAGGIADVAQKYLANSGGEGALADAAQGALAVAYSGLVTAAEGGNFGGVVSALGQGIGAVPNPHVQALFSGVNLRTHRFDWTFAPRNIEESNNLQTMLKALKAYSLPSYSSLGTAVLAYPFLCQVTLHPQGDNLIQFAPCLIQNVEINYAPQGLPAFHAGSEFPAFVEVGITMMETEIHTSNRYGRSGGDRIEEMWDTLTDSVGSGLDALGISFDDIQNTARDYVNNLPTPSPNEEQRNPSTGDASTATGEAVQEQADHAEGELQPDTTTEDSTP